jgi:hypothetical protein
MVMELILTIGIVVLAALLMGSIPLFRSRREERREPPVAKRSSGFQDCYDLCKHNPRQDSDGCATMCAFGWP